MCLRLPLPYKQSRGHTGDVHDTKTTKPSLTKTKCKQGIRNISHVLTIVAFLVFRPSVRLLSIAAISLVAKVEICFFFLKQLVTKFDHIREENASISISSTNTCDLILDELPDTRNDENEASYSVKEPVAEL